MNNIINNIDFFYGVLLLSYSVHCVLLTLCVLIDL